jgi:predicted acyl esterase
MTNDSMMHSRRSVLRGLGVLGAMGAGVSMGCSYPVMATQQGESFTKTDRIEIDSFDGTTIAASFYVPDAAGPHPSVLITHGWGNSR